MPTYRQFRARRPDRRRIPSCDCPCGVIWLASSRPLGLVSVLILPAAGPVGAADPVVLRVGTVQDLDAMNPYLTEYYVGWEVFGLNYQGLVDFGLNGEPIGGFAKSWTQDGNTWTFKIDPNLKWSDGTPATSEDARWTLQTLLDQPEGQSRLCRRRLPRPVPHVRGGQLRQGTRRADPRPHDRLSEHADPDLVPARSSRSTSGRSATSTPTRTTCRSSGPAPTRPSSGRPASTSGSSATPTTRADPEVRPGRDLHPVLQERSRDDRGPQVR